MVFFISSAQSHILVVNPHILYLYTVHHLLLAYLDFLNKAIKQIPVHFAESGFFFYSVSTWHWHGNESRASLVDAIVCTRRSNEAASPSAAARTIPYGIAI